MLHEKRADWLAQDRASVIEKLNREFQQALIRLEEGWLRCWRYRFHGLWRNRSSYRRTGYLSPMRTDGLTSLCATWLEIGCTLHWGAFRWSSFFQFLQQLWYPHWVRSGLLTQLLAAEDVAYFLTISQCLGHKPVPFISVLDSTFGVWFKKVCAYSIPLFILMFNQLILF